MTKVISGTALFFALGTPPIRVRNMSRRNLISPEKNSGTLKIRALTKSQTSKRDHTIGTRKPGFLHLNPQILSTLSLRHASGKTRRSRQMDIPSWGLIEPERLQVRIYAKKIRKVHISNLANHTTNLEFRSRFPATPRNTISPLRYPSTNEIAGVP